jgi:c-di-GMP-binding flagellar brake protein YcgR
MRPHKDHLMESRGVEKRRAKRVKQWNKALIRSASGPREFIDTHGINAYTFDISLKGAKIHSGVNFPAGTVIRIHIDLCRLKETVSVEGEVKWIKRNEAENVYEFGVEFLNLIPRTHLSLLKNLFDDHANGIPTKIF